MVKVAWFPVKIFQSGIRTAQAEEETAEVCMLKGSTWFCFEIYLEKKWSKNCRHLIRGKVVPSGQVHSLFGQNSGCQGAGHLSDPFRAQETNFMMHKASEIGLASVVPKAYHISHWHHWPRPFGVLKAKHWVGFGLTNQPVHEGLMSVIIVTTILMYFIVSVSFINDGQLMLFRSRITLEWYRTTIMVDKYTIGHNLPRDLPHSLWL